MLEPPSTNSYFLSRALGARLADQFVPAFPVHRLARLAAVLHEAALPTVAHAKVLGAATDADVSHVYLVR